LLKGLFKPKRQLIKVQNITYEDLPEVLVPRETLSILSLEMYIQKKKGELRQPKALNSPRLS